MCVFCAAVPATVALGAAAKAKQQQSANPQTDAKPLPHWMLALPAERVAAVVIVGLMAGSAMYHTRISPV
jgi:hypothetical protein